MSAAHRTPKDQSNDPTKVQIGELMILLDLQERGESVTYRHSGDPKAVLAHHGCQSHGSCVWSPTFSLLSTFLVMPCNHLGLLSAGG